MLTSVHLVASVRMEWYFFFFLIHLNQHEFEVVGRFGISNLIHSYFFNITCFSKVNACLVLLAKMKVIYVYKKNAQIDVCVDCVCFSDLWIAEQLIQIEEEIFEVQEFASKEKKQQKK